MSSQNSELACKAARLLFRHFSKTEELIQSLRNVQLLVSSQDVENLENMRQGIEGIHEGVEKYRREMNLFKRAQTKASSFSESPKAKFTLSPFSFFLNAKLIRSCPITTS